MEVQEYLHLFFFCPLGSWGDYVALSRFLAFRCVVCVERCLYLVARGRDVQNDVKKTVVTINTSFFFNCF